MPAFEVATARQKYPCVVERGVLERLAEFVPPHAGKVFVSTTRDVWQYFAQPVSQALSSRPYEVLYFPGGETQKRLAHIETLAEQMVAAGADRSSIVIAIGGGIVNDMGGFLASVFMRGIPVIQVPTTLLAQVDAAIGGKTGVNLVSGKNLVGTFHQPLAVVIDPSVLRTLPEREYRAGLFEVLKCGVIASEELFHVLERRTADVLHQSPDAVDHIITQSVRIKVEVVSADEREGDLRRILNFGHTIGHALEAETSYARFLHGEAVSFGMTAATCLASLTGVLDTASRDRILNLIRAYGPIPSLDGIAAESLVHRLASDKKTIQGRVHFVLPDRVGHVVIRSGVSEDLVLEATRAALAP